MNSRMRVFFNTRIRDNRGEFSRWGRRLNDWGNFLLMPTQLLFSGKTVAFSTSPAGSLKTAKSAKEALYSDEVNIHKVSAFYKPNSSYQFPPKLSKQDQKERISSTRLNKSYYVLKLISVPFFIPLGIAGAILKGLSHFDPSVRAANNHVRGKLTPENHIIQEAGEMPLRDASIPYENPEEKGHTLHMSALENRLKELLKTGQKIGDLTIRAETQVLDDICLSLIAQINPKNVLLINSTGNERWKLTGGLCPINIIRSTSNITKWAKWDLSPIGFDENAIDSSVMATRSVKSAEQKQTGQLPDPPIYQKRTEPAAAEEAKQELKPSLLSIYKKTKHTHAIRVVSQDAISHSPQRR